MLKLLSAVLVFTMLALPTVAQDIVSEAKANIETKHHKAMVEKAEKLLCQKKELESQLAGVNAKLEKLAAGQDVKVEEPSAYVTTGYIGSSNVTFATTGTSTVPGCCWTSN